jgi:hypothetical protein
MLARISTTTSSEHPFQHTDIGGEGIGPIPAQVGRRPRRDVPDCSDSDERAECEHVDARSLERRYEPDPTGPIVDHVAAHI